MKQFVKKFLVPSCIFAMLASVVCADTEILNFNSYFRYQRMMWEPQFATADGSATAKPEASAKEQIVSPNPDEEPPPANWIAPDFDDSAWPRVRFNLGMYTDRAMLFSKAARVNLRGKFIVTDTSAIDKLTLELEYRGGAVISLNGREIKRLNMPAGDIAPTTRALPYPDEAWLDSEGKPLPSAKAMRSWSDEKKADVEARKAKRTRTATVELPASSLRAGVNVLALDLRESSYHSSAAAWLISPWTSAKMQTDKLDVWTPIGLDKLVVSAAGTGVTPNVARPDGFQIWNTDPNDRLSVRDYGNPADKLAPMRLVAARNGSGMGTFVIGATEPLRGVSVTASTMRGASGATIPAAAFTIMSALPNGQKYNEIDWFDALRPGLPAESPVLNITPWGQSPIPDAALLPVMVRADIPKSAAPGVYSGELTIAGQNLTEPVKLPISLTISPFTMPDSVNLRTYVGLYQSPTSVAMRYNVEEWSEEHWKLMDKSFALLGRVGNRLLNMCVVEQTQFGNDKGMVYWIRKADGSYDYDFKNFDRYLNLAIKHWGNPTHVALQVWHSGGWEVRTADQKNTVTVIDQATGEVSSMQVPVFDTQEAKDFWRPFLAAARERLAKLKLENAMCIGILSDGTAPGPVFAMFDDIWPGGGPALWTRGLHVAVGPIKPYRAHKEGGLVVLHEHCYGSPLVKPTEPIPNFSDYRDMPGTAYFRFSGFETIANLMSYQLLPDYALYHRKRGLGRIGFDFFDVLPNRRGDYGATIYNRYPHSSCAQRAPALYALSWPSEDGPETTLRYEMLCQGVQRSEATIIIAEALNKHADKLGPELVTECRRVLYDRLWTLHTRPLTAPWNRMVTSVNHAGWLEETRRAYDCAAAVQAKLAQ